MKSSRLALVAALALSSSGAFAASELKALSESEMSDVHGRGLTDPMLSALGALTTQQQGNAAVSAAAANEALAALGMVSNDTVQNIDRQMAQMHLQTGATSVQATLKMAQTLTAVNNVMGPLAAASVGLPLLPFPLLFALPALPSLDAIQKKH